jgi:U3 small nucleolar RNA-associated protein 4
MVPPLPSLQHHQQRENITSSLHRIRFIDQTPSPITALSFAPLPLPTPSQSKTVSEKGKGKAQAQDGGDTGRDEQMGLIVVARENGELEIWNWAREEDDAQGNWVLQKVCIWLAT